MIELPIRQPDRAYRDTWLWVPKSKVNVRMLKHSLKLPVDGGRDHIELWREAEHHLGIPRERLDRDELPYEVVDLTPTEFEKVDIESEIVLDAQDPKSTDQREAFADLMASENGILNLRCGMGKTVLFLHFIAHLGIPALIINDKGHILKQWVGEIAQHLNMDPLKIGWIQGKPAKWKWEHSAIALASLKTLAMYHEQAPTDFCLKWGIVVWDELHHLAATQYSKTVDLFPGRRYGATATINRPDGLEMQYLWHVGQPVHRNLEYDLIPEVIFVNSPTKIDWDSPAEREEYCDKYGEVHIQKLCAYVGQRPEEIEFASRVIDKEVAAGGDILALSVSRVHGRVLHSLYPDSGVIDKDVSFKKRLEVLGDHKLTFATVQIAREAINKKKLDVLILLTEFSSDNNLQQAIGRILRKCAGKAPRVIVIHHKNVGPMYSMGMNLKRHFKQWNMEVKHE